MCASVLLNFVFRYYMYVCTAFTALTGKAVFEMTYYLLSGMLSLYSLSLLSTWNLLANLFDAVAELMLTNA